jgi:hypothetical protein
MTTITGTASAQDPSARHSSGVARSLTSAPRLLTMLLAILAGIAGVGLTSVQQADALVGPYVTQHRQWGDCTLYIGTVPRSDFGAVGGTDVWCGSARGRISVAVSLWRYNGASWVWISNGSRVTTGLRSASAETTPPSYIAGCASWDITATVNVDGYQISIDYANWAGRYPRYNPANPGQAC